MRARARRRRTSRAPRSRRHSHRSRSTPPFRVRCRRRARPTRDGQQAVERPEPFRAAAAGCVRRGVGPPGRGAPTTRRSSRPYRDRGSGTPARGPLRRERPRSGRQAFRGPSRTPWGTGVRPRRRCRARPASRGSRSRAARRRRPVPPADTPAPPPLRRQQPRTRSRRRSGNERAAGSPRKRVPVSRRTFRQNLQAPANPRQTKALAW